MNSNTEKPQAHKKQKHTVTFLWRQNWKLNYSFSHLVIHKLIVRIRTEKAKIKG